MQLPDEMPEGCNFYAVLQTDLSPQEVAQRFVAAGWTASVSAGSQCLNIAWAKLTISGGTPMVLRGWLDRPDDRVAEVLGVLSGLAAISQWINAQGRLWRDMPFDESMLDPDDPRLPKDIKESILASGARETSAAQRRKPWWKFW